MELTKSEMESKIANYDNAKKWSLWIVIIGIFLVFAEQKFGILIALAGILGYVVNSDKAIKMRFEMSKKR
ncbi:hypothetical protein J4227_01240 [Candidatus Woesearchaeota archaeon]|nr:hypothetical protein [Candidatus Woesearchaeota archaeon]